MKANKYYKSRAAISLSLCLFAQNVYANKCEDAVSASSVLKGVGETSNTEIIHSGVMRYQFSFPINSQRKKIEIKFHYNINGIRLTSSLLSPSYISNVLKSVLDEMPEKLLSQVNRITINIIIVDPSQLQGGDYESLPHNGIIQFNPFRKDEVSTTSLKWEETRHFPVAGEMTLKIPISQYMFLNRNWSNVFSDLLADFIRNQIQHKLGHIIAYQRYGRLTPDQEWHNALLSDQRSVSEYGNINMAEDFAESIRLYLRTNAGLGYPETAKNYAHRFRILDEIMGIDFAQRRQISERNHLSEEQNREIDSLFKELGIDKDIYYIKDVVHGIPFENIEGHEELSRQLEEAERDSEEMRKMYVSLNSVDRDEIRRDLLKPSNNVATLTRLLAYKALALHRNEPLDFTSINASSTRELLILLIRFLIMQVFTDNTPQFIINTIHSLDTLSIFDIKDRFRILEYAIDTLEGKQKRGFLNDLNSEFEQAIHRRQSFNKELRETAHSIWKQKQELHSEVQNRID